MESASANQYVIDLSKNVKRGLETKLTKGWLPNLAPAGYLNDQIEKTIIKDTERFNLISKMWQLMITGSYTPPRILKIANEDWGYRTRKTKRLGGKPLSRSGIYKIFTNIFYAGILEHKNRQFEGKHEPMITLDEYDRVQVLMGRKGKPRPKSTPLPLLALSAAVNVVVSTLLRQKRNSSKRQVRLRNTPIITAPGRKRPLTARTRNSGRKGTRRTDHPARIQRLGAGSLK